MSSPEKNPPKVFVSYAWSTPDFDQWVTRLASRLVENGVDVIYDKWDLKPGQDMYVFMEQMATSTDIDNIIVICDKNYKEKSDQRIGGVGTETQILSPRVYKEVSQERIIPVIAQLDDNNKPFIPTLIQNRIFIDLSSSEKYETGYEELLRHLFKRPLYRKPELGRAPSYIFEDAPTYSKISNVTSQIKDAFLRNPGRVRSLISDFNQSFFETLSQFNYQHKDETEVDDIIVGYIHDLIPVRNEYVNFVELICKNEDVVEPSILISFFEELYSFTNAGNGYDIKSDHFKFLCKELFLFTVMIFIKFKHFVSLQRLLNSTFFIRRDGELIPVTYYVFNFKPASLDEKRNNRLNLRLISVSTDLLIQEHSTSVYGKNQIIEADLLLYYYGVLNETVKRSWYPHSFVYNEYIRMDILQRLQSRTFAESVQTLFGSSSIEELKLKFENFRNVFSADLFRSIPTPIDQIDITRIGSMP